MATVSHTLTSGWTLIAGASVDFIVENRSVNQAQLTFSSSAPAADAPYHVLQGGLSFARLGVAGSLYARSNIPVILAVSTS